jgi:1-acyl-sn-glycerol-3-phosphate acyltransferase
MSSLTELLRDVALVPEVVTAIGRLGLAEHGYDPWGFSVEESKFVYSLGYPIYRYFRPVVEGIEGLPPGRMLIVANHSGQLPFDGVVLTMATLLRAEPPRLLRPMVERWVPTLPVINVLFSRAGVVLGDPINCRNLLEADQPILVFPEGAAGLGKTWWKRYQLETFGRGFMRLALQTGAPIVPVAIVGAEEALTSIHNARSLAKLLHFPYLPIPPLLPFLGPLAFLPLPTRFYLRFGEPMHFSGPFDDEDAVIDAKVAQVKERIETLIASGRERRKSVFV